MTVQAQIEVVGIKEALAELNTINKKLRRRITVEFREIVQPVVSEAKYLVPAKAPMSGWNRAYRPQGGAGRRSNQGILPYSPSAARAIKPYVSGKRPRTVGNYTRNLAAFGVRWTDRRAVLFDASGQYNTPQGQRMVQTLTARYGRPSRAMWRAYEQAGPDVQQEVVELVERVMKAVNRNIKVQR